MEKISVLIADDHTIVRHGLVSLLSLCEEFEIVGEAENGRDAVDIALAKNPNVVLMDIGMPILNGLEATRQIRKLAPHIKVLILSGYDNDEYILQVIQTGANGYILKNSMLDDLYTAIRSVQRGQAFFSPAVSKVIVDSYVTRPSDRTGPAPKTTRPLTSREREILQLIAEGHLHHQIAERLKISVRTVDTHRNNIMKKLDLHDTASLVTYAIKNGILIMQR
ncbi:MAG: response regulator transcription factor [Bacteroidetes bacterium]|nr:response regulator transcription factor [Bacteroidota bacterium]MCW5895128.1 response regulator transcription factor [Bacteroidota bacterium]